MRGLGLGLSMTRQTSGSAAFSPASLFAAGEKGGWYDPSDLSTLFQNSNGTGAVSADGDPVGYIADKSGNGNHLIQATAGNRPLYKTSGGLHWLQFDGSNDELIKAALVAGGSAVATVSCAVAFSDEAGFDGYHALNSGGPSGQTYMYGNGTSLNSTLDGPTGDPSFAFADIISTTPRVHTHLYDMGAAVDTDQLKFRLNGALQSAANAGGSTGGGTFADCDLYLGHAPAVGVYSACKIYGFVLRYAATASPAALETYLGAKCGVVL